MSYYVEYDIDPFCCAPDMPIREVLLRINSLTTTPVFQIVVDEAGKVVGTATDGDIRRGILAGNSLDDPIRSCMHQGARTLKRLDRIPEPTMQEYGFLPHVDETGKLAAIVINSLLATGIQNCLIMAGGYGKRLGNLTLNTPKPLVALGDRPILAHILMGLERFGIRHAYLSVHFLADQFKQFAQDWNGDIDLDLIHETEKLGTAGALGLYPRPLDAPVLVINGDVLTNINYLALKDFHDQKGYDATIGVTLHDTEIPFGIIQQNKDGTLAGIEEKPVLTHFVAAGIYYLSPKILDMVPEPTALDMPDLINLAAEKGLKIGLFPIHEYWRDIGRPPDLKAAGIDLAQDLVNLDGCD
ncbi:sugar phosphate nucleotidyltransferase [Aestuariispira insulae]|uniref:CBS domain protein n=1 Tax=Aestuariispira insulae TaxID=1461337 RepID=A0A3D9H9J9_9PROT|nr:sugar phosphate nucleotidyltransferase [Aestuariispira insulae]RED46172.1 CBS domain protein [Aestuariispira insulae]